MEDNYKSVLTSLKRKIELLIQKYESQKAVNAVLSMKLQEAEGKIEKYNNRIKELEQRLDNIQLMEAFKSSSDDVMDAKRKIGRLVRQIDKCIALLNDD